MEQLKPEALMPSVLKLASIAFIITIAVGCSQSKRDIASSEPSPDSDSYQDQLEEVVVTGARSSSCLTCLLDESDSASDSELRGGVLNAAIGRSSDAVPIGSVRSKLSNRNEAEQLTWRRSTQTANNSVIKIGDAKQLTPKALDVQVQIDGFRARVVVDGFYHNSHNSTLEGAFKYRLPNGARPYFFAFGETFSETFEFDKKNRLGSPVTRNKFDDLNPHSLILAREDQWKEPKQAIMVAREKAALAYTSTVARQVDPALLEWSGSGVFSAKVFPLQAQKLHRVVIGYDLDLQMVGSDLLFDFPLDGSQAEKRIHVKVADQLQGAISFHEVVDGKVEAALPSEFDGKNHQQLFVGDELDGVRVMLTNQANVFLTGADKSGAYFATRHRIDVPVVQSTSNHKAVFALDTSWSAAPEKFQLWVDLLMATLENNQASVKEFALMTFNIDSHWWQQGFVKNDEGNRRQLLAYLNESVLEGATDLNRALQSAAKPAWLTSSAANTDASKENFDLFLYSDGAVTWGESEPYFLSENLASIFDGRLLAYRLNTQGENAELLNHLTREFNGSVYQVAVDRDITELSRAHNSRNWRIESIELNGAQDLILEGRPRSLYAGQELKIAGRVASKIEGPLRISLTLGGLKRTLELPIRRKIESSLAPRIYGQISVNQLESLGELQAKVATAYANHFRVPGASSSLLMLESEEDYRAHNIKPEEDAFVVASRTVSSAYEQLADDFKAQLTNQKQRFKKQLDTLVQIQNIDFKLPNAVSILIDLMPQEAFALPISELTTQRPRKQDVSQEYLSVLGKDADIYSAIEGEANARRKIHAAGGALTVMSSLVEVAPGDSVVLREVAYAAQHWGQHIDAFNLHRKVADVRPYEPQNYSYLAELAEKLGKSDLALLYYEVGLGSQWTGRFGDYPLIHKIEYLNFLKRMREKGTEFVSSKYAALKEQSLAEEIRLQSSKLLVSVSWNTDRTDVDLHVIEPNGERCYYSHNRTKSGGYITRDVTTGYGPEMYVNEKAPSGRYKVYAKYFSSDRNKLGLKTKVQVKMIKHWGTKRQAEKVRVVSLAEGKDMHKVGEVYL